MYVATNALYSFRVAHEVSVGYRGTRDLIFKIGNIFIDQIHEPTPDTWRNEQAGQDGTPLATATDIPLSSAH